MIDLDEDDPEAAEIAQVADEVAQEVADRAADEVAKEDAGSPDDTFIRRRFAWTAPPGDPEMRAAWEQAGEIVDERANKVSQEAAERAAQEAPGIAYERILRKRRVADEAAHKTAQRAADEVRDEAYERTREKVYDSVCSTMFPGEFRKAMRAAESTSEEVVHEGITTAATGVVPSATFERKNGTSRGDAGLATVPRFRRAVVPVDSIIVEETFGRELDDPYVDRLAAIVERYEELRGPVIVTPELRLLAGHRWLAAVQRLGRQQVEVLIAGDAP